MRTDRLNAAPMPNLAAAWRQGLLYAVIAVAALGIARGDTDQAARAASARARHNRAALPSSALEGRIQSLTDLLVLDTEQQHQVREILMAQRAQVARVWTDGAIPAAYRVSATRAVGEHTADSIRGLLNDDQKQRFAPPPQPRDPSANRSTDELEAWLSKMNTR